jgi:hypothetical protein
LRLSGEPGTSCVVTTVHDKAPELE